MKLTTLAFTASTLFSLSTYGFPRLTPEHMKRALNYNTKRDTSDGSPYAQAAKANRSSTFNPEEQLIDVTGQHTFQPPNLKAGV